ncbi:hypothetical protein [Aureibacter tunicatorum]|uniref:Uncharacterized protein n=1 Tax=Aureibacter tunicatorum TaxID=866807 RepID=A0AAE3XQK6_9BACT|nr:hypothetical protein [Aureibacter tunicatorum]MDR6240106.1 hypothetical protein [Aureibacter tunicatorum]BDD06013.1 hypothetical protein AUTU_34960 [Aureibacter tunicatorum]
MYASVSHSQKCRKKDKAVQSNLQPIQALMSQEAFETLTSSGKYRFTQYRKEPVLKIIDDMLVQYRELSSQSDGMYEQMSLRDQDFELHRSHFKHLNDLLRKQINQMNDLIRRLHWIRIHQRLAEEHGEGFEDLHSLLLDIEKSFEPESATLPDDIFSSLVKNGFVWDEVIKSSALASEWSKGLESSSCYTRLSKEQLHSLSAEDLVVMELKLVACEKEIEESIEKIEDETRGMHVEMSRAENRLAKANSDHRVLIHQQLKLLHELEMVINHWHHQQPILSEAMDDSRKLPLSIRGIMMLMNDMDLEHCRLISKLIKHDYRLWLPDDFQNTEHCHRLWGKLTKGDTENFVLEEAQGASVDRSLGLPENIIWDDMNEDSTKFKDQVFSYFAKILRSASGYSMLASLLEMDDNTWLRDRINSEALYESSLVSFEDVARKEELDSDFKYFEKAENVASIHDASTCKKATIKPLSIRKEVAGRDGFKLFCCEGNNDVSLEFPEELDYPQFLVPVGKVDSVGNAAMSWQPPFVQFAGGLYCLLLLQNGIRSVKNLRSSSYIFENELRAQVNLASKYLQQDALDCTSGESLRGLDMTRYKMPRRLENEYFVYTLRHKDGSKTDFASSGSVEVSSSEHDPGDADFSSEEKFYLSREEEIKRKFNEKFDHIPKHESERRREAFDLFRKITEFQTSKEFDSLPSRERTDISELEELRLWSEAKRCDFKAHQDVHLGSSKALTNSLERERSILPDLKALLTGGHEYTHETVLVQVHIGEEGHLELMKKAYQSLRQNAAPGAEGTQVAESDAGTLLNVSLLGTVKSLADESTLSVVNKTMPGHMLHPGAVLRQVVLSDRKLMIRTTGIGKGVFPKLNNLLASTIWEPVDAKIRESLLQD